MSFLQSNPDDLTIPNLMEALQHNHGFLLASQQYIAKKWNLHYSDKILKKMIKDFGLTDFINQIRSKIVEDCYRKTYLKGVQEGDATSLQWYLNRYGHHVDFLDTVDGESDSKRDTKSILERITSFQPEAD